MIPDTHKMNNLNLNIMDFDLIIIGSGPEAMLQAIRRRS